MLIYDADCAFCTVCARWAQQRLPLGIPVVGWQSIPDLAALGLTRHDVETSVWWIGVDGRPRGENRAVAACLGAMRRWWSPLAALLALPPLGWVAAPAYRLIARNRHRMPGATAACRLDDR